LISSGGGQLEDTDFSGTEDSARACPDLACFNFACPYIRNRLKCNNLPLDECRGGSASAMSPKAHEPCACRILAEGY
jgi:hypothetical protein